MRNFKLIIEYDGTGFHGWQRQKEEKTVQGEIEAAVETITRQKITLIGSGRTDAGVHALGQTANFKCETGLSPEKMGKAMNSLLRGDIVIHDCREVPPEFHARYDVAGKIYEYHILNRPLPSAIDRRFHWHIAGPLDIPAMREAIVPIRGRHDFKAFEGTGSPRSHTVRHVMAADLLEGEDGKLLFRIEADGFLRFMVRNIVGTLVEVGRKKILPEAVEKIREGKDRSRAGATAPPQGLFLMMVRY